MKKFFKRDDEPVAVKANNNQENKNIIKKEIKKEPRKMNDSNVTTLTPDVEIKGSIKFTKTLEMNGKFEGDLITDNGEIVVGPTGQVKANFKVKNAVIEGRVDGNVTAEDRIELKNNAQLIGDLTAKTLSIEEGVLFVGQCNVNPKGIQMGKQQQHAANKEAKK